MRTRLIEFAPTVTLALLAAFALIPVPYTAKMPGPTKDVLGVVDAQDATAVLDVSDATTYPTTGELLMTTVEVNSPQNPPNAIRLMYSWVSSSAAAVPVETVYPSDQSVEEVDEENAALMENSQEVAIVAALTEAGYEVPAVLTVVGGVSRANAGTDAPAGDLAADVVEDGDILTAVDGQELTTYADLSTVLAGLAAGDEVTATVERNGTPTTLTWHTIADPITGGAKFGLYLNPEFSLPVHVTIGLGEDIGGPSAGSTFALGIVDKLSGENLTAGKIIGSTGTIDADGSIGPIGGIRQKLMGAFRDGARSFLAPASNCDEVVGHIPSGMSVFPVATLHEAHDTLRKVGMSQTAGLPTCNTVLNASLP